MKEQLLFIQIVLSMIFCSCSKTVDTDSESVQSITPVIFDSRMVETRAQDKTEWVNGDTITIWTYEDRTTLTKKTSESLIRAGSLWKQPGSLTWPAGGNSLSFFAFHKDEDFKTENDNAITIDWTVSKDVAQQKDLLWASVVDANMNNASGTGANAAGLPPNTGGGVTQLKFVHALSKIAFVAATNTTVLPGDLVTIDTLTLINVKRTATSTITKDLNSMAWGSLTDSYNFVNILGLNMSLEGKSLGEDYLFIPQGAISIRLAYTVSVNTINKSYSKTYQVGPWEGNKKYIYKFSVSSGRVIFEPSIGDWDSSEEEL